MFKSRLQEYAQKAGLPTPEYHTLKEGPSHEPVFKSTVLVNNTRYESLPGFFSRKAAAVGRGSRAHGDCHVCSGDRNPKHPSSCKFLFCAHLKKLLESSKTIKQK